MQREKEVWKLRSLEAWQIGTRNPYSFLPLGKPFKQTASLLSLKRPMGKAFGFTLAEVLISLGIIGVIAAMTIPNLFHDTSKQETVTKVEKEYTSLSQAVKMSEIDNGNNAAWDWGTTGDTASIRASFDLLWAPYVRIAQYCDSYTKCGYKSNNITDITGANKLGVESNNNQTSVMLADGTLLIVYNYNAYKQIYIDINGPKGPSTYGKDVFAFSLSPERGLIPMGGRIGSGIELFHKQTINDNCSSSSAAFCAAKLMMDNWKMNDDYPWK